MDAKDLPRHDETGAGVLSQNELFQRVTEICMAVNTVNGPQELLKVSLEKIMDLYGAERGSIFLLDKTGEKLVLRASVGMELNEKQQLEKQLGEGIVGRVAQTKTPIFVDDISTDARFRNYQSRRSYRTPSFICAPLLVKDALIGVINLSDKGSGGRFNQDELILLDFLTSQVALNYRRIILYRKFKTVVQESINLKTELGRSSEEATHLKRQVVQHERLASIGKLAGGIAHEFNNPLDGVMRYTSLCLELAKDHEVMRGYLLEIKQGLNRMANIVKSLLACSRNAQLSLVEVDPNVQIEQAVQLLHGDLLQKHLSLKVELCPSPPRLKDYGVERVASNLIRNAIDASPDHGVISVRTACQDGGFVLEVSDNGRGIAEEMLEKIFEPFYTTKDMEKGCGLGLTIVDEVVKSFGGDIRVESAVNAGTLFRVTLPLGEKNG